MNEHELAKQVIDKWLQYIEHFGKSRISSVDLLSTGLGLDDICTLIDNAVASNEPLTEEYLEQFLS